MHVLTLDHLSGGRVVLGMGVSGPQVVEGWYGQPFAKPLARTREVVDIVRQVLAREAPVTNDGPHYPLPYAGEGSVGLGKPLKPIVHPLRADVPIWLGAEGPKNVADDRRDRRRLDPDLLHARSRRRCTSRGWTRGSPGPGARAYPGATSRSPPPATCRSPPARRSVGRSSTRSSRTIALYMGGMGAKEQNFHKNVFDRMGYDTISDEVQELFLAGKRDEATALIPDDLVEEMHIVGDAGYVKERVAAWEETGVTTLLLSLRSADEVRLVAETLVVIDLRTVTGPTGDSSASPSAAIPSGVPVFFLHGTPGSRLRRPPTTTTCAPPDCGC